MNPERGRKKNLPPLICLCLVTFLYITQMQAQSAIRFAYDSDGNRITRTIQLSSEATTGPVFVEETIAGIPVKIYPDGSGKKLTVAMPEPAQEKMVTLYCNEELITEYTCSKTSSVIDLSKYQKGEYALHITVDGQTSVWQIIQS